ncbi:unnamed protein product [Paramecium pentaurelia]|uniref:Uncharacterized protein n=1 Tax=Paramecium pentaurelia TaxID=43138 RepID=A0A8S1Y891_9CILI|nr:unnamed protein product [Paramecium pentaurelia]
MELKKNQKRQKKNMKSEYKKERKCCSAKRIKKIKYQKSKNWLFESWQIIKNLIQIHSNNYRHFWINFGNQNCLL